MHCHYDIGTFTSQYAVGSSVKGGTLLAGYQNNAINVGEEMVDEPLKFAGGLSKHSYFNQDGKVTINDKEALMHSSNVYMFKTALKMAGAPYTPNMTLPSDITTAGQKLRKGLNQVGLGVKTGIDLPNETSGQTEPLTNNPGNYLDLAIGQYDTYIFTLFNTVPFILDLTGPNESLFVAFLTSKPICGCIR